MRIEILGCSGGVGPGLRTTSLLLDGHVLLDAGTGVGDLTVEQMQRIDHVFLTHSHLDHVCGLAFMADNLFDVAKEPVQVHATSETLAALRKHVFNWVIWPDFFELPGTDRPLLQERTLQCLEYVALRPGFCATAFPVHHTVPAVGYAFESDGRLMVFTGDTTATPRLWTELNRLPRVDKLIVEVAFPDEDEALGAASKHFTPSVLASELKSLKHRPELLLTHHKPGDEDRIKEQCRRALEGWSYRHLQRGDIVEL
jgi:ribonuclease BN (tRNA processing enzyme)